MPAPVGLQSVINNISNLTICWGVFHIEVNKTNWETSFNYPIAYTTEKRVYIYPNSLIHCVLAYDTLTSTHVICYPRTNGESYSTNWAHFLIVGY